MKTISEIRKVVNFCRKNGITYFKDEGFEFRLTRSALKLPKKSVPRETPPLVQGDPQAQDPYYSLLWSANPVQYEMGA